MPRECSLLTRGLPFDSAPDPWLRKLKSPEQSEELAQTSVASPPIATDVFALMTIVRQGYSGLNGKFRIITYLSIQRLYAHDVPLVIDVPDGNRIRGIIDPGSAV